MNQEPTTITVPPGYKAILVLDEVVQPTPDYDECARQANLASGLPDQSKNPWLNIFIREINRWCWQAYASIHGAQKDAADIPNDALFAEWLNGRDPSTIDPRDAFMGACALRHINPKQLENQFYSMLGYMVSAKTFKNTFGETPYYELNLKGASYAATKEEFLRELITDFIKTLPVE